MSLRARLLEHRAFGWFLIKWLVLATPLGIAVGSACALFLWSLEGATEARWRHPELIYGLPLAGIAVGVLYAAFGKSVEAGNNLIVDEIHEPGGGVPLRMAPLILIGTVVTHLFGGSAGREGTAVQMGGSLASGLAQLVPRLTAADVRILLMAGIAAGFGGVFGTPVAGAVFALEVLVIGRMNYTAIVPCLIASVVADQACIAWGIGHTHYHVASVLPPSSPLHLAPLDGWLLGKVILASATFGLTSVVFAELVHGLHHVFKRGISLPVLRPAVGGALVIGLMLLLGTRDYLGLGVSSPDPHAVTILSCFHTGGAQPWSWLWKLLFTAVTLSSGFKGGEVTPLFFIGAALGNTLAVLLGAPVDLFAALGFIGVFAGATNTPLACILMGIELFGGEYTVYFATACIVSYLFSGHHGIYLSQRIGAPKVETPDVSEAETLRGARDARSRMTAFAALPPSRADGELPAMTAEHRVVTKEIGQLRIYVPQGETRNGTGLRSLFSRPLFRELIDLAKSEGLLNATSHVIHSGYTQNGRVQGPLAELPNPHLTACVELIDQRESLEVFCRKHADLLRGRVLVYKHLEHWELQAETLTATDATVEELQDSDEGGH